MIHTKENPKLRYFLNTDDAVAEVLDFVTIIGILILSFSILGLVGYPILRNAQEARYIENTQKSFNVLADNINKVALGKAPSQRMEVKMYGGALKVTGASTIQINATNSTNKEITLEGPTLLRSLENSVGDTVVAYEGTGVWIKYPTGTVLNAYKPLFTSHSNKILIPVVYVNGDSYVGGNGISRVTICPDKPCSPEVFFYSNMSNLTVTITGNYSSGWKEYFDKKMGWEVQSGSFTVTGRLNTTKNLDVYILKSNLYTVIT